MSRADLICMKQSIGVTACIPYFGSAADFVAISQA
jgi:hypothetical protein